MHAGIIVLSEIIFCVIKWLKFPSKILIYVNICLSLAVFANKWSPVSCCTVHSVRTNLCIYILSLNTWDIKCRHPATSLAHFSI